MYPIDKHLVVSTSGLPADANILLDAARKRCQQYTFQFAEPMPVEQLVKVICDYKQSLTQFGGSRPYGVAFMYAGYDVQQGFQLYCSDPSGNYARWKANATGVNNVNAISLLKKEYKDGLNLDQGLVLGAKVMIKTMDTADPGPEKCKILF